jgi:spore germination protein
VADLRHVTHALGTELAAPEPLSGHLASDLERLSALWEPSDDIVVRVFEDTPTRAAVVFQRGLVDEKALAQAVGAALRTGRWAEVPALESATDVGGVLGAVLGGRAAVLVEGRPEADLLPARVSFSSTQPKVERVVRGPRQGLTRSLDQNLGLLHQAVPSKRLRVEGFEVGRLSPTRVAVAYVEGLAPAAVLEEVRRRLRQADVDGLQDVTELTPSLADDPWSPFPNVQTTERVDAVAMALLAGRVAVLAAGSASTLLVPATFANLMVTPEDQYLPRFVATFVRLLRYASAVGTLVLEPLYISVTSLHQELLPTPLAFAIARSRTGVPLPVFAEVLVMALVIEVLREAAIRLPQLLSQTITIVGALVIGESVVRANLISAPVIIVVAVTALTSFVLPDYEAAITIRLLRFPAMISAGLLGLFGLSWYCMLLVVHMARLRSFGVSYLAPLAPRKSLFATLVLRLAPRWRWAVR